MLRSPASPAKALRKDLYTASGSEKRFGRLTPLASATFALGLELTGCRRTPQLVLCQFVAHCTSLGEPVGEPVLKRTTPASCHPPRKTLATGFSPLRNFFPWPNGSPATQFALKLWRTSKLETEYCKSGLKELR